MFNQKIDSVIYKILLEKDQRKQRAFENYILPKVLSFLVLWYRV